MDQNDTTVSQISLRAGGKHHAKRANLLNTVYIAKLKWDLTNKTHKPRVNFFLYKNITCYNAKRTSPYVYKRIFKGLNIFEKCTNFAIVRGRETRLWLYRWINNIPYLEKLSLICPTQISLEKMCPTGT